MDYKPCLVLLNPAYTTSIFIGVIESLAERLAERMQVAEIVWSGLTESIEPVEALVVIATGTSTNVN